MARTVVILMFKADARTVVQWDVYERLRQLQ